MEEVEDGFARETGRIANKPSETKETTKKIIRVLTVITYLCSVSMAAIILSLYYLFLWNPSTPSESAKLVSPMEPVFYQRQVNFTLKSECFRIPAYVAKNFTESSRMKFDNPRAVWSLT